MGAKGDVNGVAKRQGKTRILNPKPKFTHYFVAWATSRQGQSNAELYPREKVTHAESKKT